MTDITLEHLSLSYGDLIVFDDFTITLAANSVTGIAGRSGCGKTSLLRAAARRLRERGYRVSACFQEDRLLPHRTVAQNIEFVAPGAQIGAVLEAVELAGTQALYPRELSGGMRQRAALARALAHESDVLLLDEPFKSLDAALAPLIRERLFDIARREGRIVLFVSHDPLELAAVCDTVHIVHGPPLAVAHTFTRDNLPHALRDIAALL